MVQSKQATLLSDPTVPKLKKSKPSLELLDGVSELTSDLDENPQILLDSTPCKVSIEAPKPENFLLLTQSVLE